MAFSLRTIFLTVFGKKKDLQVGTARLVNMFTPFFSDTVNPKLNDTFMSCVNAHAKHISKIKPTVFLKGREDKAWMTKILCLKPNPIMEAGTFWEKVARLYFLENNVFIYLDWNLEKLNEPLKSMWILNPDNMNVHYHEETKEFFLSFNLQGKEIVTSLDNIVHLARNVDTDEIFGQRSDAINSVLSVINTNFEGIENAVKTSSFLRFVINTTTLLDDKTKAKKAKEFADTYLAKDGTGVAYMDSSSALTQVNSQAKYANADEMKIFENKILNYMSISESILKADFSENQWQAYYESNIEAFCNKLQNALTIKLFTQREKDAGNHVVISSEGLQVVSVQTKINLVTNTKELGLFTINEYRKMFNMPPVPDGDTRMMSLNYIDASKAADYQLKKAEADKAKAEADITKNGTPAPVANLKPKEGEQNGNE